MKMTIRPSHTQVPDVYLDVVMRQVSPAEFKVLMAISRFTFGWQKRQESISLEQLMEYTALSNRGVLNAVGELEKRGLIFVKHGHWKNSVASVYRINLDWDSVNSVHRDSVNSVHRSLSELSSLSKDISQTDRHKNEKPPSAEAPPRTAKPILDPRIKAAGDRIYNSDKAKFQKLSVWINQAQRDFPGRVALIAEALEQFAPYAAADPWWPYLDKIFYKLEAKDNARESELQSERHKKELKEIYADFEKEIRLHA